MTWKHLYGRTLWPGIYTNKAKRNLFACFRMAGHAQYGMAPYFGHTRVAFDAENDRPGPRSCHGHFEDAQDGRSFFENEGFVLRL